MLKKADAGMTMEELNKLEEKQYADQPVGDFKDRSGAPLTTDFEGKAIIQKKVANAVLEKRFPNDIGCLGFTVPEPEPLVKGAQK